MKILLQYDYPAGPGGLSTQGELLYRGLLDLGVEVCPVHFQAAKEKEWYYRWFKPDVAIGVGYWGHTPHLVLHPRRHGVPAVPWLVADGYIANYLEVLNDLPLILVTSHWVKEVYMRDGVREEIIEVLPVGCNTGLFIPRDHREPKVAAIRESLGVAPEECLILTVGGDAASKGAQEVMQALATIDGEAPPWRYVCKVWPQKRTLQQNLLDMQLAAHLGIEQRVTYTPEMMSRNYMPYLMAACDIYAAPSHLEGFGMPQVEANACGKPVLGINAMGLLDTMVHGETAFLASVAREIRQSEAVCALGPDSEETRLVHFDEPRVVDYRPDVNDISRYLRRLMQDPELRGRMGAAGRERVVALFDYRVVARRLMQILSNRLGIN